MKISPAAYLLGVVILVSLAFYLGSRSNSPATVVSSNQDTATSQIASTTGASNPIVLNTNLSSANKAQACAQQAALVDSQFRAADPAYADPSQTISYKSHYNAKEDKCFYLGTAVSTPANTHDVSIADTFFDPYTSGYGLGNIASYSSLITGTYPHTVTNELCMINGVKGCSYQQFASFVNANMEGTTQLGTK